MKAPQSIEISISVYQWTQYNAPENMIFLSTSIRIWNFIPILCLLLLTYSVLYIALVLILCLSGLWHFYILVDGNAIIIAVNAAYSFMVYVNFNAQFSKMLIEMYHLRSVIIPYESSNQIIHFPIPVHQQSYYLPKFMYARWNAVWICTLCSTKIKRPEII